MPRCVWLVAFALAACTGRASAPAPGRARDPAAAAVVVEAGRPDSLSEPSDSGPVIVDGPVVVAAFITTQAEIDSSPDAATALDDFQYYVPGLESGLRALGVAFAQRYRRPVEIQMAGRRFTWQVPADSGGVGYLFLAPGRPPKTFWGVDTDTGILDEAKAYFGRGTRP